MSELSLWAPITKRDVATRTIEGPISGLDNKDLDGQIVDAAWLRRAVGPWSRYGNIREQHNPQRPVGKATTIDAEHPSGVPHIIAKIVDNDAWAKIEAGVLSGFSVGIKNARIVKDAGAPKGRIIDGDLIEVSVVDHPANPDAKFAICKSAGYDGGWVDLQTGAIIDAVTPENVKTSMSGIKTAAHTHGTLTHTHTFMNPEHDHCPTCGDDNACCSCDASLKAAGTFAAFQTSDQIHPDHNTPAGEHMSAPVGNFDGDAPDVHQQQAVINQILHLVKQLSGDTRGGAHFNPNNKPNTGNTNPGFLASTPPTSTADQTWHGAHPNTATPQLPKAAVIGSDGSVDHDAVYKTALEACSDFFSSLLEDDGTVVKGVALEADSTKAVFVDVIKAAVASVVSDFSERLAQVESLAMPPKGNGYVQTQPVEKRYALNSAESHVANNRLDDILAKITDDDRHSLAQAFISGIHAAGPGASLPQN